MNESFNQVIDDESSIRVRTPPVFIKNITNYSSFVKILSNLTVMNNISCKSTSSYLIIRPYGRDQFYLINEYLNTADFEFYSFCSPCNRPCLGWLSYRNLHHSTLIDDVVNALNDLRVDHSVRHIVNNKKNKCLYYYFLWNSTEITSTPIFLIFLRFYILWFQQKNQRKKSWATSMP